MGTDPNYGERQLDAWADRLYTGAKELGISQPQLFALESMARNALSDLPEGEDRWAFGLRHSGSGKATLNALERRGLIVSGVPTEECIEMAKTAYALVMQRDWDQDYAEFNG